MKLVVKIINKILSALRNTSNKRESEKKLGEISQVRLEVFSNLAASYELLLNQISITKAKINPDRTRIILLSRLLGTPPSEAYFIIQALAQVDLLDGDICEFGVAQGETSALIANEIFSRKEKILHLFDSFEGLPKPTKKDKLKDDIFKLGDIYAYEGKMACPEEMVISRMNSINFPSSRYVLHRGFIEKTINTDTQMPKRVSFAYVDFDFYEPIKITLNFLQRVTTSGSVIIIDDYDFFSTGVKTATDEFLKELNSGEKVFDLFVPDKLYGCFAILTRK